MESVKAESSRLVLEPRGVGALTEQHKKECNA